MNRTRKLILFFFLLLSIITDAQELEIKTSEQYPKAKLQNLDLYLLIGQSNMAGRAQIRAEDQAPIDRVYLLTTDEINPWVVAKNPMNRHSTIRKKMSMQRLGPSFAFAKSMAKVDSKTEIGLIVNARGGTKIVQWLPGTHYFEEAVRRTKTAMNFGTLRGIIWHQGESDSDSLRTAMYLGRLEIMINGFREAFDDPDLAFIAGEIPGKNESQLSFNKMLNQLPNFILRTDVISSKGNKLFDGTHFNSESSILIGQRYAAAMQKLLSK